MQVSIQQAIENWTNVNANSLLQERKIYFSFDREKGWKLLELNLFQRLLRWIFGAYSSTHRSFVQKSYKDIGWNLNCLVDLSTISRVSAIYKAYVSSLFLVEQEIATKSLVYTISNCSDTIPEQNRPEAYARRTQQFQELGLYKEIKSD